jgi:hypothetical protein
MASGINSSAGRTRLSDHLAKTAVLKAEILWTLQIITNHNSYHSNEGIIYKLFEHMFPDSAVAKQFLCGDKDCISVHVWTSRIF